MTSSVTRSQSKREPLGCGRTGGSQYTMLSRQYGAKFLRNVSSSWLNVYQENFRKLCRHKGGSTLWWLSVSNKMAV